MSRDRGFYLGSLSLSVPCPYIQVPLSPTLHELGSLEVLRGFVVLTQFFLVALTGLELLYVDQAGFRLKDLPALASCMLGLKMCVTTPHTPGHFDDVTLRHLLSTPKRPRRPS